MKRRVPETRTKTRKEKRTSTMRSSLLGSSLLGGSNLSGVDLGSEGSRGMRPSANTPGSKRRKNEERTNLGGESKRAERLRHVSSERREVEDHEGFALELRRMGKKRKGRSVPIEDRGDASEKRKDSPVRRARFGGGR